MKQVERVITAADGVPLHFSWQGLKSAPAGTVLVTHGLGEHSSRYCHVVKFLSEQGFEVACHDLRGHGRSGGRRGDARGFNRFLDDMETVLYAVEQERKAPSRPLFLFGHSLGGLVVLRFLEERRQTAAAAAVTGGVVAAPWIRLAFSPEWWKLAAAGVARWIAPGYRQVTGLDSTRLSRDREFMDLMPDKSLGHHLISARLFYDIHRCCLRTMEEAPKCDTPLLLLHGEADPVTSAQATSELFERIASRDKTLRLYPEMVHELHNDLNREAVMADIADWLSRRAGENRADG